ncbi:hypothetical protein C2G38_2143370 [Gigaspora rosea]|uniref:Uncharacterized protein n=1 Tax=Gigaspora rosea TaxID=44941 RepID=A0A397V0E4_9GLOM|nr:hypothetical protein C2G38_2143370 [Gigaspora rosea]
MQTAEKHGFIPPISAHSATLLPDNQSIIIYGGCNQTTGYSGDYYLNNARYLMGTTVNILNISNGQYRWDDLFTPPPIQRQSMKTRNPNITIIVSIIGGIIGGILCLL